MALKAGIHGLGKFRYAMLPRERIWAGIYPDRAHPAVIFFLRETSSINTQKIKDVFYLT